MKKRPTSQDAAVPESTGQSEPASALITPPDVLRQACACCGAILPAPLSRLDAIPGQEHLRRAVTGTMHRHSGKLQSQRVIG